MTNHKCQKNPDKEAKEVRCTEADSQNREQKCLVYSNLVNGSRIVGPPANASNTPPEQQVNWKIQAKPDRPGSAEDLDRV